MSADTPFPTNPELLAIAVAYKNKNMIADEVLPRVTAPSDPFKYFVYSEDDAFRLQDDLVGRRSDPNVVSLSATELQESTEDHGLDDFVPDSDVAKAPKNYDPRQHAVMQLEEYIQANRESRTAQKVFSAASYAAGNKVTLAGTSQWSDFTNSNPVADIKAGLLACLQRPNIAVFGAATWSMLSQHPKIVSAALGNSGTSGVASRQAVAGIFELEDILVGEGWVNTAAQGLAPVMTRLWGKHASLIYRNRQASTLGGLTFGYTAEFGTKVVWQKFLETKGLRGNWQVRNGESLKEVIIANKAGYFFENAVA